MRNFILTTTLLVTVLCLISLPISTFGLSMKPWPKPSEPAAGHHHHKGFGRLKESKVSQASSSVSDSNAPLSSPGLLPGFPNIPGLPNIPVFPIISGLPNIVGIPIISGIPSIPEIPNVPRIPSIPEIPNIPRIPNIPQIPNVPRIPNIPQIPNIPGLPNLPGLPSLPSLPSLPRLPGLPPLSPVQLEVVSQSAELEKCLKKDGSKTSEKCSSQIFSTWAKKDFALDKECCEIVLNMDKKCYSHVYMLFKSPFFVSLLRYSCHIKHTKN